MPLSVLRLDRMAISDNESLNDLDMEIKEVFFTYVKNIAEADGEVADEERELLQNVADVWGLSG